LALTAAMTALTRGVPEVACEVGATLGEGPCWSAAEQKLWFVDIKEQRIHRYDPQARELKSWPAPAQPGWVFPLADGRLVTGLKNGLHVLDPRAREFAALHHPEPHLPGNRLNDAAVDRDGRVWFGTMDDAEQAESGCLYVFDGRGVRRAAVDQCAITNGPAFSPDGRTLYHVDTLGGKVYAFDVADDCELRRPRLFASIDPNAGYPDGPTVDSAGCVWIGLYGGWGVRRYSAEGTLLDFVRFPVANVTKIAFGGRDLRTVYATTAAKGLSAEDRAAQPHAGDLFAFRTDVPGLPLPPVRLEH
jgi:sugar lactone lactonase YvrE